MINNINTVIQNKLSLVVNKVFNINTKVLEINIRIIIKKIIYSRVWRTSYNFLNDTKVLEKKISDTLFIFGSGYSLNSISSHEFSLMEKCDTLSFNWFICQNFLDIDFHLIREPSDPNQKTSEFIEEFKGFIKNNKFKNTTYLLQYDLRAETSIELLSNFVFKEGTSIYGFSTKSRGNKSLPSRDLKGGLIHSAGTLTDCISFAYAMRYKKIILVGVDLYDRRYFWLNDNETRMADIDRGAKCSHTHNTADPIINVMKLWVDEFSKNGVELYVYNKKSLLAKYLPVFKFK